MPRDVHASKTLYNDVRDHFVLVRHDPDAGAMRVLLRVEGAEDPGTRAKLRELGFAPSVSSASVSWKRPIAPGQLGDACASVRDALHDEALFDVGTSFDEAPSSILKRAPAAWEGRFLVHVGGTQHCVVFDASTERAELMSTFAAARDDYWANDYHPATE